VPCPPPQSFPFIFVFRQAPYFKVDHKWGVPDLVDYHDIKGLGLVVIQQRSALNGLGSLASLAKCPGDAQFMEFLQEDSLGYRRMTRAELG
jgi:hypothetical protein